MWCKRKETHGLVQCHVNEISIEQNPKHLYPTSTWNVAWNSHTLCRFVLIQEHKDFLPNQLPIVNQQTKKDFY
jgi:hypothetical protein